MLSKLPLSHCASQLTIVILLKDCWKWWLTPKSEFSLFVDRFINTLQYTGFGGQTLKDLIRMHVCAGWSGPSMSTYFLYSKGPFSSVGVQDFRYFFVEIRRIMIQRTYPYIFIISNHFYLQLKCKLQDEKFVIFTHRNRMSNIYEVCQLW